MRLTFLIGLFGLSFLVLGFLLPVVVHAQVIVNEVMADPAAASDKSEWVELYNTSDVQVDLRGWSLDSKLITSANPINIPANGYYIVTKTLVDFTQEFGAAADVLELGISLTNSGKTLALTDGKGYTDSITYGAAAPNISWERKGPLCSDLVKHPTGHSLNQKNAGYSNQCYPQSLIISSIEFSADGGIHWSDTLSAAGDQTINFRYTATGPAKIISASWQTWDSKPLANPALVSYYPGKFVELTVHTDQGDFVADSKLLTVFPRLVINEFMANPDGDDSGQEWAELYNPNAVGVSLQSASLRDATSEMLAFAADTIIPANGYLVATLPSSKLQNCQKPAVCADEIDLNFGGLVIDSIKYDDSRSGQSWSKDATGTWRLDMAVTPGAVNTELPQTLPDVQISEIFPSPQSAKQESEWIELYNWGDSAVDLTGWEIHDRTSSHTLSDLIISPHQYLVLTDIGVSLNNGGDTVSLFDQRIRQIDTLDYQAVSSSFAVMRVWADSKYSLDTQVTAKPTSGLRNLYLAEPDIEKVIVNVPVKSTSSTASPTSESDATMNPAQLLSANSTYSLPDTTIHKLDAPQATETTLKLWPLFLVVLIGMLVLMSENIRNGLIKLNTLVPEYGLRLIEKFRIWKSQLQTRFPRLSASG